MTTSPLAPLLAVLLLMPLASVADTLELSNGERMKGAVLSENETSVTFQSEGIAWTLARSKIVRIEKDQASAEAELEWDSRRKAKLAEEERQRMAALTEKRTPDNTVVLYTTAWCGVCTRARSYLKQRRIPYVEKDIERSAVGLQEYKAMQRQGLIGNGVPVIVIGRDVLQGFSADWIDQAVKKRR